MASSSLALFLTLNLLLLFVMTNSCSTCPGQASRTPKPGPSPNLPRPGPSPNFPRPGPSPNTPNTPQPGTSPNTPQPGTSPNTPQPGPNPNTPPQPGPSPPGGQNCPRDALKLGVCADVLGLVNITIGAPPRLPCCSLLGNLVDLEAAVCLCTAIRANILGINLNIPVALSLVLNYCGVGVPPGFQCN